MKVEATENFAGVKASMCIGEKADLEESLAKSLLEAGYVKSLETEEKKKGAKK